MDYKDLNKLESYLNSMKALRSIENHLSTDGVITFGGVRSDDVSYEFHEDIKEAILSVLIKHVEVQENIVSS